jgi:hypothetical protein
VHEVGCLRTTMMLKTLAIYGALLVAATCLLALTSTAVAALPDNRAYEMVSPVDKGGLSLIPNLAVTDPSGDHVIVDGGAANSLIANDASWMLETRNPTGWTGVQIGPSPAPQATAAEQTFTGLVAASEDLTRFAFQALMPLDSRISRPGLNVYTREGSAGPLLWVSAPPAPLLTVSEPDECSAGTQIVICTTNRAVLAGTSADLSTFVWGQYHPLVVPPASLPGSAPDTHEHGYEVYESSSGHAQLVGVVPSEGSECNASGGDCVVPACGAAMGNEGGSNPILGGFAPIQGAVSGDGAQVIFTSPDPAAYEEPGSVCVPPEIYLRENGTTTIEVSASQRASADPSSPQEVRYAGSSEEPLPGAPQAERHINTIFFTSKEELTNDANTGVADEGDDLYAYSVATGELSDITPENNTPGPSGPKVTFLGSSTNGRLVYFTATTELTEVPNDHGEVAQPGASNLYVYDALTKSTVFIADGAGLTGPAVGLRLVNPGSASSQVTPSGQSIVFVSTERLTSYDNFGLECATGASNNEPTRSPGKCAEVYLYSHFDSSLVCVSCNASGAPPVGSVHLPEAFRGGFEDGALEPGTLPLPRAISDDGHRIFFDSPDRLTNEAPEPAGTRAPQSLAIAGEYEPSVYEYEEGQVHLIAPAALLLTSTPSGDDVFFDTYAHLSANDADGLPDVYDARVGGGFPVLAPPACSGTSCQGVPAPAPLFETPASVTFNSPAGNFPPPSTAVPKSKSKQKPAKCKRGLVKGKRKCVRMSKSKRTKRARRGGSGQ